MSTGATEMGDMLAGVREQRNGDERSGRKRRDTCMQILEHEFTDTPTCGNTTVTHTETGTDQTDLHTCIHVWPDTHRLNMHQQTATDTQICTTVCSHTCIPSQKPTIQHTGLTRTHKYICAHTGMHRYTYAHRHTHLVIQVSTHT